MRTKRPADPLDLRLGRDAAAAGTIPLAFFSGSRSSRWHSYYSSDQRERFAGEMFLSRFFSTAAAVKRAALALPGQGPPEARKNSKTKEIPHTLPPKNSHAIGPCHTPTKGSQPTDPSGGQRREYDERPKTDSPPHAENLAARHTVSCDRRCIRKSNGPAVGGMSPNGTNDCR